MSLADFQQQAEIIFKVWNLHKCFYQLYSILVIFQEYFENADKNDLIAVLEAMNIKNMKPEVTIVTMAY